MNSPYDKTPVVISADIEFDINGALTFPATRDPLGSECVFRVHEDRDQGLGFLLDCLARHGQVGSFFIETLCARHFGHTEVRLLFDRIGKANTRHEVELHLHPEWSYLGATDWRRKLQEARAGGWRPNPELSARDPQAFADLLDEAILHFREIAGRPPLLYRSGSLSIRRDMYPVLSSRGIRLSSSIGTAINPSPDAELRRFIVPGRWDGVVEVPVASFTDWRLGIHRHLRLATVAGCTVGEIQRLLRQARAQRLGPVVILTHASEFSTLVEHKGQRHYRPHNVNMKRLRSLLDWLAQHSSDFEVVTLRDGIAHLAAADIEPDTALHVGGWNWPPRWWAPAR